MRPAPRFATLLMAWAILTPSLSAVAPAVPAPGKGKMADVFGLTKVWSMHLTIPADHWKKMHPSWGNRGPGQPPPKPQPQQGDRKARGGFGYDFEYVKGDLDIDGLVLKDVAVRFKGNSTYATTARILKRPFKIDLDRHNKDQSFNGLRKLVLNNNVMDPTGNREALAYAVYRAAGVPAPRTAFALVTLTVPGVYDRMVVGLYTLIESVDRTFLEDRFGSRKGLLLKPERVGPLDYLGEKWPAYEQRYRPKTPASEKAQSRLIELTRLVQRGDDATFRQQIGQLLDVDAFLRYTAATVLLASMDSFIGLPHNYYLYHDPKRDRFLVLPWDLDHAFGALTMVGTHEALGDLSIRRPWLGRNRLIERLLADRLTYEAYTGHLSRLLDTSFTVDAMKRDMAAIGRAIEPARAKEREAVGKRGDTWTVWGLGFMMGRSPSPEAFVARRVASVRGQLAGKSQGTVLANRFGPRPALLRPLLVAADRDKDGKLSRDEALRGARALFRACDGDHGGSLDQKALVGALEKLLPKPGRPVFGAAPPVPSPVVARALVQHAGKEGKVTEERLVEAVAKHFAQADLNRDGKLDADELAEALRQLLPPPEARPVAGAERKEPKK